MYNQPLIIDRPSCFVFLVDQSLSMAEKFAYSGVRICDAIADWLNGKLNNLIVQNTRESGVRDGLHIGLIGYRTDGHNNPIVRSAYKGSLANADIVPIRTIAENASSAIRQQQLIDEETGEICELSVQVPVWVEPVASGAAPMCQGLQYTAEKIGEWVRQYRDCHSPVIIHLTGGKSIDGDPIPFAKQLCAVSERSEQTLLFHCPFPYECELLTFPSNRESISNPVARLLFDMSSVLPDSPIQKGQDLDFPVTSAARCIASDPSDICRLLMSTGTR